MHIQQKKDDFKVFFCDFNKHMEEIWWFMVDFNKIITQKHYFCMSELRKV